MVQENSTNISVSIGEKELVIWVSYISYYSRARGKNHNPESPKLSRESNAPSMVSTVSPLLLDILDIYKNELVDLWTGASL